MLKWQINLINPDKSIKVKINRAMNFVMADLDKWIETELSRALVYGGFGIQGIQETSFYRFISSADGLSQLGIDSEQPPKLLEAYRNTIAVKRSGQALVVKFGDTALLKLHTPHPAAGTGNLHVASWLEWIVDDVTVDRGFIPRDGLPESARGHIRLDDPLGGLMLPRGQLRSLGFWRFPTQFRDYEIDWLKDNIKKIENAIFVKIVEFLSKRINS